MIAMFEDLKASTRLGERQLKMGNLTTNRRPDQRNHFTGIG